jgi:hypothetical protein
MDLSLKGEDSINSNHVDETIVEANNKTNDVTTEGVVEESYQVELNFLKFLLL